jgi:hypothetical protein
MSLKTKEKSPVWNAATDTSTEKKKEAKCNYCKFNLMHDNDDAEVMAGFLAVLKIIFYDDEEKQVAALVQLPQRLVGIFSQTMVMNAAKTMPAWQYWSQFGTHLPELREVAVTVLSQVGSVGTCERNWKEFDHIHTHDRNALGADKLSDYVYVYHNLRTLRNAQSVEFRSKSTDWLLVGEAEVAVEAAAGGGGAGGGSAGGGGSAEGVRASGPGAAAARAEVKEAEGDLEAALVEVEMPEEEEEGYVRPVRERRLPARYR